MKAGVKDVIQDGAQVTVVYDNGEKSVQNFVTEESALVYCSGFGRGPGKAAAKPATKAAAKKSVAKKAKK